MLKIVKTITTKLKCKSDKGEWTKNYCTNNCKTCGYNK